MPKKVMSEKRPPKEASASTWAGYWSRHPKEHAEFKAKNAAREKKARLQRLAKHQPKIFDIQSNDKYLTVKFVRVNGDVWLGEYKLWSHFSQVEWNRETTRALRRIDRYAADAAQGNRPPGPGNKPRS